MSCSTARSALPGTVRSTCSISVALAVSVAKSSPKTFTATSVRPPETISLIRISIGCVKARRWPGISRSSLSISSVSSACVPAFFQRARGLSVMNRSVSSTPIGSVAISAVPIRLQTCSTSSGNARRMAFSISVLVRIDSSMSVPARRTTLMTMAPSESRGTNSEPRFGAIIPKATTRTHTANPITSSLLFMQNRRTGH